MNVRLALSATLTIILAFAGAANAEQIYSLGFPPGEGSFDVIEGKPYLLRKGEPGSPGNAVDITTDGRLIHYGSKKPLAYPMEGDTPIVTLGKSDAASDIWNLSAVREGRSRGAIQAKEGAFKGWYLDWSEKETEVVLNGRTLHARQLILVKEPKEPKTFSKYPVAP